MEESRDLFMPWKKIRTLKQKYNQLWKHPEQMQWHVQQYEREHRNDLQKLAMWLKQLRKEEELNGIDIKASSRIQTTTEFRAEMQGFMRKLSQIIFQEMKEKYPFAATFEEVMKQHSVYYYQHGIMKTLHKKRVIEAYFQQLLRDIMPAHPKDEFPETREMRRLFTIHVGPTNSGKTYGALQALKEARNGTYLAPLRLLALEIYEQFNRQQIPCSLLTGEEELRVSGANYVACTVEKANFSQTYDVVVIDECQMIGDAQRGAAWSRAIFGMKAMEIHVCCAPESLGMVRRLIEDCGDYYEVVEHQRHTPLIIEESNFRFPNHVEPGDALIVFSRRMALQVASTLMDRKIKASVIYGNLPPETRRKQVELFAKGENQVVVATDAIGMGLNLPIRRIVFLESSKFDGVEQRPLKGTEVRQIAGRAGRLGMYEQGFVNSTSGKKHIKRMLETVVKPLEQAYVAPNEQTILSLPVGTLTERLQAWANDAFTQPYFAKLDISEWLDLLKTIERYEDDISQENMYRAISIPFHQRDMHLMNLWLSYVRRLADGTMKQGLPKPPHWGVELEGLERYYRALNLYYAWHQAFRLPFDGKWIRMEREKTADEIHHVLKTDIQKFGKKCTSCKKPMSWNAIYNLCDECHTKRFMSPDWE